MLTSQTPPPPPRAAPGLHMERCRSCGARVYWLVNVSTGNAAPINVTPDPQGRILIDASTGQYEALGGPTRAERAAANPTLIWYTNHFACCPDQARWRKHPSLRVPARPAR